MCVRVGGLRSVGPTKQFFGSLGLPLFLGVALCPQMWGPKVGNTTVSCKLLVWILWGVLRASLLCVILCDFL